VNRIVRTAASVATAVTAAAGIAALAPAASAEQMPVLVSQSPTGSHQIWVSPSEDYPDAGSQTYWGFVPLDGLCGFAGSGLTLSDIREVYSVAVKQNGAKAGSSNSVGKIEDEKFTLVEKDPAGIPVRTFTGTGTEYAQFRGTGTDGAMGDQSVNLRVSFRGADDAGTKIAFAIKLRVRSDAVGKQQFSAVLDGCHVGR
jgi:hypothetical protein